MSHLVATRFTLSSGAAELIECFEEERLDVVRLQPSGFRAFHVLSNAGDAASIHYVVGQSTLLKQALELRAIDGVGDSLRQFGAYLRALAITDGLNQQIPERPALELEFAEHV